MAYKVEEGRGACPGVRQPVIVGLLAESLQELQVDQPWGGTPPGMAVVRGIGVGHILVDKDKDLPVSNGMDWYKLNDNKRYTASQLCYFRRTWDSYKSLLGEHLMKRLNFCFRDWYALNNAVRDARAWDNLTLYSGGGNRHWFCKNHLGLLAVSKVVA
jgi:hypothetical protein